MFHFLRIYSSDVFINLHLLSLLQREKELLRAVENQRRLLEEACETCASEENRLYHLEEQLNRAQEQVYRSPVKLRNTLEY